MLTASKSSAQEILRGYMAPRNEVINIFAQTGAMSSRTELFDAVNMELCQQSACLANDTSFRHDEEMRDNVKREYLDNIEDLTAVLGWLLTLDEMGDRKQDGQP